MAAKILDPGLTEEVSSEFTVGDAEQIFIGVFTESGGDLPAGPVLRLQRADINGNFISVSTAGLGLIHLSKNCQQVTITSPGVYRVLRPDISAWGVAVGVQHGI